MARDITREISQLVKNQFPSFYHEEGEMFIAFVKAYYEWLESNNQALYHSRRLPDYKDIDKTIDDFIIDFKNKFLVDVQFNVATNKRLFIKNALEFYRAKGTSRAVDLFFKLVYGLEARVYEPSRDLFRLSDNEWTDERYLEILPNPKNLNFVGKQIFGSISGATAFAEKLVRVKSGSKFIEVLYLSGLSDNFVTNELIYAYDIDVDAQAEYRTEIVGSLTHFTITASDAGFEVGEKLYVKVGSGKKAQATVSAVQSAVGIVDFTFVHGGWGYSTNAQIIGSDKTMIFDNVQFTSNAYFYHNFPFEQFTPIKQDVVRYYLETTNTTSTTAALDLAIGTEVYAAWGDDGSNTVVWEGTIVDKSIPNSTLDINYTKTNYTNDLTDDGRAISGNNDITFLFANVSGNTVAMEIDVVDQNALDVSVEGNVIATSNTCTISYTTSDTDTVIETNEIFYQADPTYSHMFASASVLGTFANTETSAKYINLQMNRGYFRTDLPFYRTVNGDGVTDVEYQVVNMSNVAVGIITSTTDLNFKLLANTYAANTALGTFCPGSNNNVIGAYTTKATIRASSFENTEGHTFLQTLDKNGAELTINKLDLSTIIDDTANIDITDTANSPFEHVHAGNTIFYSNTTLDDALNYTAETITLGEISSFVVTSPGAGYGADPMFIVYEPTLYHAERYDFYLRYKSENAIDDLQKAFIIGENITTANGTKAKIRRFNQATREIYATRLHLSQDTSNTVNLWTTDDFRIGDTITGDTSRISAIIETIDETRYAPRSGLNADIKTLALSGTGFITDLRILDSGFGYFGKRKDSSTGTYVKGEEMTLASFTDSTKEVSVLGYNLSNGIAPGQHPNRRSFLSSDKYLHDNNFYQEYSYQVLTALPFSKYKSTLVDVLHLAGSKPFGGYVGTSEIKIDITPTDSIATYDIKNYGLWVNQNTFYSANVA